MTASPIQRDGPLTALKALLEIVIAALFLTTFVFQPSRIPSGSMEPTLRIGDFLLLNKQAFAQPSSAQQSFGQAGLFDRLLPSTQVHRGDLIVFHYPIDPSLQLVKRVVGLPGDRIRLRDGHVLLNEQPLAEPYTFYSDTRPNTFRDDFPSLHEADPNVDPAWWIYIRRTIRSGEITVPPNSYFVLGDNRNDSEDSRYWGFVPGNAIVGRALLVYFAAAPPETLTGSPVSRLRTVLSAGLHGIRVLR